MLCARKSLVCKSQRIKGPTWLAWQNQLPVPKFHESTFVLLEILTGMGGERGSGRTWTPFWTGVSCQASWVEGWSRAHPAAHLANFSIGTPACDMLVHAIEAAPLARFFLSFYEKVISEDKQATKLGQGPSALSVHSPWEVKSTVFWAISGFHCDWVAQAPTYS